MNIPIQPYTEPVKLGDPPWKSWQDLGTILAKSLSRSCHGIHFAMVRSYQESHVPKKNFIVKSYLARKNLEGSQQKLTSMQIYIV